MPDITIGLSKKRPKPRRLMPGMIIYFFLFDILLQLLQKINPYDINEDYHCCPKCNCFNFSFGSSFQ